MANLVAFSVLLMYLCSDHGLLSSGNFQSPGMPLPSHSWSAQLSGGRPLFTAVCWHTNNQSNTTTACRHVPKKHICKKPILPTSTIKMECDGEVLQGHHIRGRAISQYAFIILHSQWRCGARLCGSKSNPVNLILRLFLYHFLHTMSS
jgi:hypothetical protein